MSDYENKNAELKNIKACSIEQMWLKELDELKVAYLESLTTNKMVDKLDSTKKSKKK